MYLLTHIYLLCNFLINLLLSANSKIQLKNVKANYYLFNIKKSNNDLVTLLFLKSLSLTQYINIPHGDTTYAPIFHSLLLFRPLSRLSSSTASTLFSSFILIITFPPRRRILFKSKNKIIIHFSFCLPVAVVIPLDLVKNNVIFYLDYCCRATLRSLLYYQKKKMWNYISF